MKLRVKLADGTVRIAQKMDVGPDPTPDRLRRAAIEQAARDAERYMRARAPLSHSLGYRPGRFPSA